MRKDTDGDSRQRVRDAFDILLQMTEDAENTGIVEWTGVEGSRSSIRSECERAFPRRRDDIGLAGRVTIQGKRQMEHCTSHQEPSPRASWTTRCMKSHAAHLPAVAVFTTAWNAGFALYSLSKSRG